jgi:hydroxyacylglutathione hydrolase
MNERSIKMLSGGGNCNVVLFFERTFPSANMVLIKDEFPVLVDTGFGSDWAETERLIREAGISPETLLIVNTHYHSDHVGGNHQLQKKYGTKIAAHKWEADLINACHPEACCAEWLDQPVDQYRIDRRLSDGDEIHTGRRILQVVHTPGHTLGHISLYEPEERILICGDLFHENDIGWINIFREGVAAVQQSIESLDRLASLPIRHAFSGHGPALDNPLVAIDHARNRLEKWLHAPEKMAWHACKRIFAYTLMMYDGLSKDEIDTYLPSCGWFRDFARYSFQLQPDEFVPILLDEMLRSKAASWRGDDLIATTPYQPSTREWMERSSKPRVWTTEGYHS